LQGLSFIAHWQAPYVAVKRIGLLQKYACFPIQEPHSTGFPRA